MEAAEIGGARRPRVLAAIVVPPHLSVSGGARAAEQLSAALAPYCDMTVANMNGGAGAAPEAPRRVHRLGVHSRRPPLLPWSRLPNRYGTLFYRSDLPGLIAGGDYDLIHLHNPMPALEFERVAKACQANGIPYVISTHGFNEVANGARIYGFGRLRRQVWRHLVVGPVTRAVRGAAAIFALSPADLEIIRGMGYRGAIAVVSNGVPVPEPADPAADRAILDRLGIDEASDAARIPSPIRCMFLANHTPNKGLPNLLAAFARLDLPYTLVVGGERRDGIDYEGHIGACRRGQRIIVTGRLTDAEVAALFRWSELFVFPTLADTLPLVVLEAMAHGVPVLASRVGGIPYQVAEGCGLLVPPGDIDELANAVATLARDRDCLTLMGRNARARVAAVFSWESAAGQALDGYRQALGWPAEAPAAGVAREPADVE